MVLARRLGAEAFGTFWLVLGGCGAAVLAANAKGGGIGILGVAFAFGLTVLTMAYAVGHISGGHFNPAVTVGLWLGNRFEGRTVLPYVGAQLVGGILGAGVVYAIANGQPSYNIDVKGLAANGFANHSPGGYSTASCLLTEVVMTLAFVIIIMGATDHRAPKGFGPAAIGLGLTLIHLISIPVTNTSVNPARSTGPAIFQGGWALSQLWMFWVAPIAGAVIAGLAYRFFIESPPEGIEEAQPLPVALDLREGEPAAATDAPSVTVPAMAGDGASSGGTGDAAGDSVGGQDTSASGPGAASST